MKPIVITSITSTGFSYVFEKTAGNNPPSSYPTMMPSVSSVPTSAPYQNVIPCDCSVNNTFIVLASVSGAINALTAITIFVFLCCTRQIAFFVLKYERGNMGKWIPRLFVEVCRNAYWDDFIKMHRDENNAQDRLIN
jgi:hypothetical protein